MSDHPPARPASTILLLRNGPTGLEVLMVERNVASEFASGALVFPGGRVDDGDMSPDLHKHCRRAPDEDTLTTGLRVAGVRETWEDARMLLARPIGTEHLLTAEELEALETRIAARIGRAPDFTDLATSGEIELATDQMVRFSHWITPAGRPKRYDTHFFLAPMPTDQKPQGDGHETVHTIWISPDDAIAGGQSKRFTVVFATRLNLGQLAQDTNVATAMARAAASTIVTVCPEMLKIEGRRILRLPLEAGYGGPDFDADDIPIP